MAMGVFPDKGIRKLKRAKIIRGKKFSEGQVQPSSFDLQINPKGYCLPCSSLPFANDLDYLLKSEAHYRIDLRENNFCHKNNIYVFEIEGGLELPENLEGKANPKSTIGRIDVHSRLVTEGGTRFDFVPKGYHGRLWLEIYPFSFDILPSPKEFFNQLRIKDSNTPLISSEEIQTFHRDEGILYVSNKKLPDEEFDDLLGGERIGLRVSLEGKVIGYKAKPNAPPVDFSKRNLPASKYFDKVCCADRGVIIDRDSFYIFSSLERVRIPVELCSEMDDISTGLGEYRAHYAGFFDPGFNAQATLEIRNLGAPFLLEHKQKITSLNFTRLKELPKDAYGAKNHYQGQKGPKLAKFFDANR